MIIKWIELCEQMVVKWAAAQLAQTTAATTGPAARAAAEESAASAGMLGTVANAIKAIMTDAAQTFAGVFAFLSPVMGPAAAGPAEAAQASVAAAAVFDVGTDYVVRGQHTAHQRLTFSRIATKQFLRNGLNKLVAHVDKYDDRPDVQSRGHADT